MNYNLVLKTADNKPAIQQVIEGYDAKGVPTNVITKDLTLGDVLKTCLNSREKDDKLTKEQVFKRGKQAYEISQGIISEEFSTVEGVAELKDCLLQNNNFLPLITYQAVTAVEEYLATKLAK